MMSADGTLIRRCGWVAGKGGGKGFLVLLTRQSNQPVGEWVGGCVGDDLDVFDVDL